MGDATSPTVTLGSFLDSRPEIGSAQSSSEGLNSTGGSPGSSGFFGMRLRRRRRRQR